MTSESHLLLLPNQRGHYGLLQNISQL